MRPEDSPPAWERRPSRQHVPRHRPSWWPEGEPWPPVDPEHVRAWREMRGRFLWRIGGLVAFFFAFIAIMIGLAIWLAASLLGWLGAPRGQVGIIAPVVIIFIGLLLLARAFQRIASPIGDLMQAAGRVEEGDYAARVRERGPREVRALARAFNSMAARLQASDTQRRDLLADVTHELRTPLTVIQGNLEGLLDGVYPRDDAHLAPILEETRVLSRLIDDLRTLALADAGALKLQKEPTDLATLTSETVASFRAQADAAGIELGAEVGANIPALELDPARIRQVLDNLIANALRYTPRGGRISVQCSVVSTQEKRVEVCVSDTGAGIPADELSHIFERFHKSRDARGTGLGLAIAKNLVAAHGGEISAQSEPGKGTIIRFSFPVAHMVD